MRHTLGGMTISQALGADAPKSGDGAINLLLIGLDSRKDQDGNDLPQDVLDKLHAGDSDSGGYNTNTLILAHISTDNKVVAFSIPRDDYIAVDDISGYSHIKIKEAYGLKKAEAEQHLIDEGVSDQAKLERQGREAGRAATLSAVRDLTGVPIDYFAEINLAGFYDLASSLGGIEVCLNHPVYDDYSGADFPAGRQTLDGAQALAFVRQRHGLDNGDLDRTHRQQAFLVSVMRKLQDSGTFTNLGKLSSLMDIARKDIVLSTGWTDALFRRVGAITGSQVRYQTLPVLRYDTVDDQDVNIVDPAAIKKEVAAAFSGGEATTSTAEAAPSSTVDVINAGSTSGLADTISQELTRRGYTKGEVRNPLTGEPRETGIDYGSDASTDAQNIATLLGIDVAPKLDSGQEPGHIRVILGSDYALPSSFGTSDPTAATAAGVSANSAGIANSAGSQDSDPTPTPDRGQPVVGAGVPCVN
ncbi:MAG: LCP family protein [Mycobacteriaceae bacterium]|nr:LCP family protein [Mycobacteriaceae bacterium]MBV9641722.1 LCP family protein [Mycobacteriaceae bacterium]